MCPYKIAISLYFLFIFFACKQKAETSGTEVDGRTPVTITSVLFEPMEEFIELNATSAFLQRSYLKANVTGYIKEVNTKYADNVHRGQTLFVLQTKESDAIGNTINKLDPDFKFSGINKVKTGSSGYVSELSHQVGDYVQDGEQLAVISNANSFAFIMNVPYEYKQYVTNNKQVELTLPGGERIHGTIQTSMPFMDSVSQTQAVAIKVNTSHSVPENLVAKVKIIKVSKPAAISLPKSAILSDETQSEFWVMKMLNDSTAVKIPVKKGIEIADKVEIISPSFNHSDKILLSGNYGLADTAQVKVELPGTPEK